MWIPGRVFFKFGVRKVYKTLLFWVVGVEPGTQKTMAPPTMPFVQELLGY